MIGRLAVFAYLTALAVQGAGESAKNPVEDRLARSVTALQSFRESATDATRKLFDSAVCVVVAPRRTPDETTAGVHGFLSCRPAAGTGWSNPAAILIEGGGVYWPVVGADADIILLAMNRPAVARLEGAEVMFSVGVDALPGPVREEQIPLLRVDPEIFVYKSSGRGVSGIQIAGATMSQDTEVNAAIYGKPLKNTAILKAAAAGRSLIAVDRFLAALPISTAGVTSKQAAIAALQ